MPYSREIRMHECTLAGSVKAESIHGVKSLYVVAIGLIVVLLLLGVSGCGMFKEIKRMVAGPDKLEIEGVNKIAIVLKSEKGAKVKMRSKECVFDQSSQSVVFSPGSNRNSAVSVVKGAPSNMVKAVDYDSVVGRVDQDKMDSYKESVLAATTAKLKSLGIVVVDVNEAEAILEIELYAMEASVLTSTACSYGDSGLNRKYKCFEGSCEQCEAMKNGAINHQSYNWRIVAGALIQIAAEMKILKGGKVISEGAAEWKSYKDSDVIDGHAYFIQGQSTEVFSWQPVDDSDSSNIKFKPMQQIDYSRFFEAARKDVLAKAELEIGKQISRK